MIWISHHLLSRDPPAPPDPRPVPTVQLKQRRKGTNNPKHIAPNVPYENCSHFWEIVLRTFENISKHIFKPCYHIEFNTTNPDTIFKIIICFTKTPQNPKYFRNFKKKIDCLPPQTDTHRRFSTRIGCIIPVRIFYKKCYFLMFTIFL